MRNSMCPNEEYLSAYLDGEIPSPWDSRIASHLSGCPACREKLAALQSVSAFLKREKLPGNEERADLVRQRIDRTLAERLREPARVPGPQEDHVPFWKPRILLPLPVFAAGFLSLLVLIASL